MTHSKIKIFLSLFCLFVFLAQPLHAQKKGKKKKKASKELGDKSNVELESTFIQANEAIILGENEEAKKLLSACLELNPNHGPSLYEHARINFELDENAEAIRFAKAAVAQEPANKWYRRLLAESYASSRNFKEAAETFDRLRDDFPEEINFFFDAAFMYKNAGEMEEAIKVLDELEGIVGQDEMVLLEKQKMYMQLNEVDKAAGEIQKLIDAYPKSTNYYNLLAELYLVNKREEEAYKVYEELLAIDPENAFGQLAISQQLAKSGKEEESLQMLEKVFANPSMNSIRKIQVMMSRFNLNEPGGSADKLQTALRLTEKMIEAHPNESRVFAIKGDLLYNQGERAAAADEYRKAIEIDPNNLPIWEQLFFLDVETGNNAALIEDTENAVELFPNNSLPYYFQGIGYNRSGKYEKAIKSLKRALIIGDKNDTVVADIYSQIGESYNSLKEFEKSDKNFDKAVELAPNNLVVLNNYSYYLSLRKDNLQQAEEMSRKTIEMVPDNVNFLDTYGWILYEMGRYDEAVTYLKKASEAGNPSATVLEHYGDALIKAGDVDAALEQYKSALQKEDSSDLKQKIKDASK